MSALSRTQLYLITAAEEINETECMLLSAFNCFTAVIKKAWMLLVKETRISFKTMSDFASGCPPRMWRCNGHGNGALHPGRSCLRHQSLLLRLHPERSQVHLPQEVCTCSPLRASAFLNVVTDLGFLLNTSRHRGSSCFTFSSTFFESSFFLLLY